MSRASASDAGTIGTYQVYAKGMNGSVSHSLTKHPIYNSVYAGDTDWDTMVWPQRSGYPDFAYDRMPKRINLSGGNSSGVYAISAERDHGVAMFGAGNHNNSDHSANDIGYATYTDPTGPHPWHQFSATSSLNISNNGWVVGVQGFFLPTNYTAGPWGVAAPGDFVMLYCCSDVGTSPTGNNVGGMYVGIGRFPSVPSGTYASDIAMNSTLIVGWSAVNGTSGAFHGFNRMRFAVGSLGKNASGVADGTKGWVYACEPGGSLWRSSNYGLTWAVVPGTPAVAGAPANNFTDRYLDGTACIAQDSTALDRLIYQSANGPVRIDDAKAATPNVVNIYTGTDEKGAAVAWGQPGPVSCYNFSGGAVADEVFAMRNGAGSTLAGAWYSTNAFTAAASAVIWKSQNDSTLTANVTVAGDMQLTMDGWNRPRAVIATDCGGYRVARIIP